MAFPIPLAIGLGTQFLGGLFGGGRGEQAVSYQMSPEARQLYNLLYGQIGRGAPGYMTDPIKATYAQAQRQMLQNVGQGAGFGGLMGAQLQRLAAGESRALGNVGQQYQDQLMRQLASLVTPPSQTQTMTQPTNWGNVLSGMGGDVLSWYGLQDALKFLGRGQGTWS